MNLSLALANVLSSLLDSLDILNDISNTVEENRKRKEPEDQSTGSNTIKRRPGSISHAMYERIRKENDQLKKQIQMYRENSMCKCIIFHGPIMIFRYRSTDWCSRSLFHRSRQGADGPIEERCGRRRRNTGRNTRYAEDDRSRSQVV